MRFGLVFSAMGVVACSESGVKKFNATPEAYITSHASGDEVAEGTTETIRGQVAEPTIVSATSPRPGCTTATQYAPTPHPTMRERSAAM
jgi:hypothetical protein